MPFHLEKFVGVSKISPTGSKIFAACMVEWNPILGMMATTNAGRSVAVRWRSDETMPKPYTQPLPGFLEGALDLQDSDMPIHFALADKLSQDYAFNWDGRVDTSLLKLLLRSIDDELIHVNSVETGICVRGQGWDAWVGKTKTPAERQSSDA